MQWANQPSFPLRKGLMRSSWGSSSSAAAAGVKWDNASVHHEILHLPSHPWPKTVFKLVFNKLQSLSPVQGRNITYSVYRAGNELWSQASSESLVNLGTPGMCSLQVSSVGENRTLKCAAQQELFWALAAPCQVMWEAWVWRCFSDAKGWWENGILLQ